MRITSINSVVESVSGLFQNNIVERRSPTSSSLGRKAKTFLSEIYNPQEGGDDDDKIGKALNLLAPNAVWDDSSFSEVFDSIPAIERPWRLARQAYPKQKIVVDETIADADKVVMIVHKEDKDGSIVDSSRGAIFLHFSADQLVQSAFVVQESTMKLGEIGLSILRGASKVIEFTGVNPAKDKIISTSASSKPMKLTAPEQYFAAWNARDIDAAISIFDDDCTYNDTAFPTPFRGKEKLEAHLITCAKCFPLSFTFQVDDVIKSGDGSIAVRWHVENNGEELPFTRGLSRYRTNARGKIVDGIDFLEPAVIKPGGLNLFIQTLKSQIEKEPVRLVPIAAWLTYMYVVFFSDGILPGANAMALEQRTWEEVRDLSLNFFLISPLMHLPFSPMVHPMLEGVFNLLLSWAAMFAGFLSDDRKDKPNLFPILPAVVGMQFLTSAFLLPYLALRSTEWRSNVSQRDLSTVAQVCESRLLGQSMTVVGSSSIVWAFIGRYADFGDLSARWSSFIRLLSIDRVGSSFIVDLVIFGLFQWWLVDDDMKRRGMDDEVLRAVGKYVPFFGMAAYLALRPSLPEAVADE